MRMPADVPQTPVSEAACSLEVRWIFPGKPQAAVARWFRRFPAWTESREDSYLLDPQLRGLSVKVRAAGTLEVKMYIGSPGILELPDRARGRMESWQKWSFPFDPLSPASGDRPGWMQVRKKRHVSRFSVAPMPGEAPTAVRGRELRCDVELGEVSAHGQNWWTLGFESAGPTELLASALEETAALVFAQPLPGDVEFSLDRSRSYAEWLSQRSPAHL
jgi:hypothetical protein